MIRKFICIKLGKSTHLICKKRYSWYMYIKSCAFIFIASLANKCASFRSRFRSFWTAAGFKLETPASMEKNLLTLLNLLFQTADSTPTSQQKNRQSSALRVVTPKLSDMSLYGSKFRNVAEKNSVWDSWWFPDTLRRSWNYMKANWSTILYLSFM